MSEIIFTDKNFSEQVIESEQPVLVDFWAEWCTPCLMLSHIIKEVAEEFKGKLKVGKLNIDENSLTPSNYDIDAIPALFLFKKGKVVKKIIGVQPKETIIEIINSVLND